MLFESRKNTIKQADLGQNPILVEDSPALTKSKPKTIDIFKKLDESREKAQKQAQDAENNDFRQSSQTENTNSPIEKINKQRPVTVSKKNRYFDAQDS